MDVGIFSELQCASDLAITTAYRQIIDQAELADQIGFRSMWLAELHFTRAFSVMPAPQLVAAAIAARTRRLRLGIGVYILPVHHPLRLAEEAAALDILSEGRLEFGAGRGHPFTRVYEGFGVPADQSRERFDECLEIVRRAWTEPRLSFKGKFHSFENVELVPKPVQKPYPPIHVGAVSPPSFISAGEQGFNVMCPAQVVPVPAIKEMIASYRDAARRAGHPQSSLRVSLLLPVFVARTRAEAEEIPRHGIMSYYEATGRLMQELLRERGLSDQFTVYNRVNEFMGSLTYEGVLRNHAVFGEPEAVRDRLIEMRDELGLDEVLAWIDIGGIDHEAVTTSMKLMADKVLPHLSR
ncbi:MAG: LLM class flavin-dependent oxidoreductase [Candidatus Binataceae bacterium]|nr:LLM class flavin-dependent oxidoreductase [Candidatus Binataceae bacterium]